MRTPVFTGSCPALITPFDQNGNIDYDAFGKQIDLQLQAGEKESIKHMKKGRGG